MRLLVRIVQFSLFSYLLGSCTYHNELEYYADDDGQNLDSSQVVSYTEDIVPIVNARCYNCHNKNFVSGGVQLDTYEGIKVVVDDGRLVGVINHADGFPQMPRNSAKLSSSQISIIENWVSDGAENN